MDKATPDTRHDFPCMLYRFPGTSHDATKLQDGSYDTLIVHDEDEGRAALAEGWFLTSPEAREAAEAAKTKAEDNAPPTRAELEAKATELGIKFDGRTTDKKLGDQIAAALEQ